MITLLQATSPGSANSGSVRILIAVGLLIVVVMGFGLFTLRLRKRLMAEEAPGGGPALLLEDLRRMLRSGEISQTEYDAMRQRMVEKLSGQSAPPLSPPTPRAAKSISSERPKTTDRTAPPGYDLTGERLPGPEGGE